MTQEEIDRAAAHILATSVHELTWADGFETGVKFNEEKTAERIKKEIISKACEYFEPILCFETNKENANRIIENFKKKAMEE